MIIHFRRGDKNENLEKGLALAAAAVLALGLASGCGSEKKADSASGKAPLKVATNATYVPLNLNPKMEKTIPAMRST